MEYELHAKIENEKLFISFVFDGNEVDFADLNKEQITEINFISQTISKIMVEHPNLRKEKQNQFIN